MTLVERHVYNSFMLLGDVGGFSGLLFAIGSVLVRIFNFANAQNFVVQSLYEGELLDDSGKASGNTYELDSRKQVALKEWVQAILPSKCLFWCLRKRKRDHDFNEARARLDNDLDLVRLIRSVKFLEAAIQTLISSDVEQKLRK